MRLAAKFLIILLGSLLLLGSASIFVFIQVLKPEFQRQREESWGYRSEQAANKLEQILNQALVVSEILKQGNSNISDLKGPLLTLIGTSKIESIIVTDINRTHVELSLFKNQEQKYPTTMGQKEINYLWAEDILWVSLRERTVEIFVSFKVNDIIEVDDEEPYTFYYTLDDGRVIGSSSKHFNLPPDLIKKIATNSKAGIVAASEQNHNKILVTQVIPKFNIGIGVFGENKIVSSTWRALWSQFLGMTLVVIGIGLVAGYYFVSLVTSRLEVLEAKSLEIGAGNFNILMIDDSGDEVGSLTRTLNKMVGQIKYLFLEQQKQLRMESELKVAQTVQGTLFPPSVTQLKDYELAGFYKSASECGGDLWGVWETDRYLNFYILDATGHGVPAALITSAARAIAAFYETQPEMKIESIALGLNYAINKVGNRIQQATAFICQLDKIRGSLEYINASHVSGYVIPKKVSKETKITDITFLSDPIINRLGESEVINVQKGSYDLQAGEVLLLVTDGLFDLKTADGKDLQERRAIKKFIDLAAEFRNSSIQETLSKFVEVIFRANGTAELKDDVTLLALRRF
jgi:serine phosphatase RsbU (regulator of sigma subunit)